MLSCMVRVIPLPWLLAAGSRGGRFAIPAAFAQEQPNGPVPVTVTAAERRDVPVVAEGDRHGSGAGDRGGPRAGGRNARPRAVHRGAGGGAGRRASPDRSPALPGRTRPGRRQARGGPGEPDHGAGQPDAIRGARAEGVRQPPAARPATRLRWPARSRCPRRRGGDRGRRAEPLVHAHRRADLGTRGPAHGRRRQPDPDLGDWPGHRDPRADEADRRRLTPCLRSDCPPSGPRRPAARCRWPPCRGGRHGQARRGKLLAIDAQIDPATGTIRLKASFPNARSGSGRDSSSPSALSSIRSGAPSPCRPRPCSTARTGSTPT